MKRNQQLTKLAETGTYGAGAEFWPHPTMHNTLAETFWAGSEYFSCTV